MREGGLAGQLAAAGMAVDDVGPNPGGCASATAPARPIDPIRLARIR